MSNRFLISVATAALIAGTGFANAQGTGMGRDAGSAGSAAQQQGAPSSERGGASSGTMQREGGGTSGMKGEQKDTFTIWFTLRQRTLHYETYVMPAPEENHEAFYEHLLRRNLKLYGAAFAIGAEDAVFLVGQFPNDCLTDDELDRILGSVYAYVEQFFRPAMRIGYASKFRG